MELNRQGKVKITAQQFPLEDAPEVLRLLNEGKVEGRGVLLPPGVRSQQSAVSNQQSAVGVASRG
jgi:hypothetical protein